MVVAVQSLSCVWFFVTPWTGTRQAPLSMRFPRQGYWSGLPFPSPRDLPDPGIEPVSPVLAGRIFTPEPPGKSIWVVTGQWFWTEREERFYTYPRNFPGGSDGKESAYSAGDPGLISGLGRTPVEGNAYPFQYSCLENPMNRGAWWVAACGVSESEDNQAHTHTHTHTHRGYLAMPGDILDCHIKGDCYLHLVSRGRYAAK